VRLAPIARLRHERINECSGIEWTGDAFWVNNDSGDEPVLYRSPSLDFADPEILAVPGAGAADWEDITTLAGDVLACDIGDNLRLRDNLMLYRVRYQASIERPTGTVPARLDLIASYPVRYPDGRHDAEAAFTAGDTLYIVSKDRGEGTHVYRFAPLLDRSELRAGEANVPERIAQLDLERGDQVTAADYDPMTRTVVLLTYDRILRYPLRSLSGKPASATSIRARQCEALCFQARDLVFTNEQRDVYRIADFLNRSPQTLRPAGSGAELLHP